MKESETKQMVILGGGFADISVARELGRLTKGDPSIQVHLVSNENYFVFNLFFPKGLRAESSLGT